jgi:hypothetical protein
MHPGGTIPPDIPLGADLASTLIRYTFCRRPDQDSQQIGDVEKTRRGQENSGWSLVST